MQQLSTQTIAILIAASFAYLALLYYVHRSLADRQQVWFRWGAVAVTVGLYFYGAGKLIPDYARIIDVTKALLAMAAAGCVLYETQRAGQKRPIAERWKKFVGITLGVAAIICYFNAGRWGYQKFYHRHDQFHYYMGAKYFQELGYDDLYKCTIVAQDEIGLVEFVNEDNGRKMRINMRAEVRHPDKKIRNLGGDNLLIPVDAILAEPEVCRSRFTPERWNKFKEDVKFFRISCWDGKDYFEGFLKDHGYNPPPAWTLMGKFWSELAPASTRYMQFLGTLDMFYLAAMFGGIWWAFGWRTFAVSAVFWGTQSSAPFFWTGGAFLRQDWLFWMVMAACFVRKRYYMLAGASMVYCGLLRVFPGLTIIGWLIFAGIYLAKYKRLEKHHLRVLAGGVLAAAVLLPASMYVAGKDSYKTFYKHTLEVHDKTPLTNHMGLRVLVGHDMIAQVKDAFGADDFRGGRMEHTKDGKLTDPFETWKRMRIERWEKYKWVGLGLMAATFGLSLLVLRRVKNLWIAQALAQVWVILLSQLTCYYYSFMILMGPLAKANKRLEVPLFGFSALTQFVWMAFYWNDDKYTALTLISLIFCWWSMAMFLPKSLVDEWKARLFGARSEKPAQ